MGIPVCVSGGYGDDLPSPQTHRDSMGIFESVVNKEMGKPSLNAAQPCAKAEGCVHDDPPRADKLRKGWPFRVGTWNVDSLTGRSGELVEVLAERRMDVACVQETR